MKNFLLDHLFTSESTIGLIVFASTLIAMAVLIIVYMLRSKKRREDFAKQMSRAYSSSGRRLSNIFLSNRRYSIDPTIFKQNEKLNSYVSLPIINSHSIHLQGNELVKQNAIEVNL